MRRKTTDIFDPRFDQPKSRHAASIWTYMRVLIITILLEVMVYYAIITPHTGSHHDNRRQATSMDIRQLATAIRKFKADVGRYPTTDEGLAPLVKCPTGVSGWKGPYWSQDPLEYTYRSPVPLDKWGHPYRYECVNTADGPTFSVISSGDDGEFDTMDDVTQFTRD
jgi:general secretion pathway protein G